MSPINHPVTPSLPLLVKWQRQYRDLDKPLEDLLIEAARWGADTELEACCNHAISDPCCGTKHQRNMLVRKIRERRRPAPPTLQQEALSALRTMTLSSEVREFYQDEIEILKEVITKLPA